MGKIFYSLFQLTTIKVEMYNVDNFIDLSERQRICILYQEYLFWSYLQFRDFSDKSSVESVLFDENLSVWFTNNMQNGKNPIYE